MVDKRFVKDSFQDGSQPGIYLAKWTVAGAMTIFVVWMLMRENINPIKKKTFSVNKVFSHVAIQTTTTRTRNNIYTLIIVCWNLKCTVFVKITQHTAILY